MTKSFVSRYKDINAFVTKDGSTIRELMHPASHAANNQSLAEARVPIGARTILHKHYEAEELYYITAGEGAMILANECFNVKPGDSICIPPGTTHGIENTGKEELVLLCCCSPAYSHDDTELLEDVR